MSGTAFTFPPPPPPPPKREVPPGADIGGYGRGNRGGIFNRGNQRGGGFRGRGGGFGGSAPRGTSFGNSRGGRVQSSGGSEPPNNGFVGHREWSQIHSNPSSFRKEPFPTSYVVQQQHFQSGARPVSLNGTNYGSISQKRDHSAAFNHHGSGGTKIPAAPAVPSFLSGIPGLSLPNLSNIAPPASSPPKDKLKPRTSNILGLNPSAQRPGSDDEDEDEDEDEEGKLVSIAAAGQTGVAFEYNGRTATLKTPAEIAAWIADRKKRFPTAAKAEQAKKDVAANQKKWEEERKANMEARRLQREAYERERVQEAAQAQKVAGWLNATEAAKALGEGKDKPADAAEVARSKKTERLLKKAAKAQKQLAKVQNELKRAQGAAAPAGNVARTDEVVSDQAIADVLDTEAVKLDAARKGRPSKVVHDSDVSSLLSDISSHEEGEEDADTTSSSCSSSTTSSSCSRSGPEILSTKGTAPDHILPPVQSLAAPASASTTPCRNFARLGRCKNGSRCRFSHEADPQQLQVSSVAGDRNGAKGKQQQQRGKEKATGHSGQRTGRAKRKGLWEIMVEKEKEEEMRLVLNVIVNLGQRGMLDEREKEGE